MHLAYDGARLNRAPAVFLRRPVTYGRIMTPNSWSSTDWRSPEFFVDVLSSIPGSAQVIVLDWGALGAWRAFLAVLRMAPPGPGGVELAFSMSLSVGAVLGRLVGKILREGGGAANGCGTVGAD